MECVELEKGDYSSHPTGHLSVWAHAWVHVDTPTVLFCRNQKVWQFRDQALEASSPVRLAAGATACSPAESQ